MRRTRVESTTLRSAGYDRRQCVVELEFTSGAVYQYLDVPAAVHEALMVAESKGTYFNHEIRDDYQVVRVREQAARK
jgi:hypothetical protein